MVRPDSRMEIGPPVASGSTASTARAKAADVLVVVGVAGGRRRDADPAVGGAPTAGDLVGQVVERDRLRLEQVAHVVEIELSGTVNTPSARWRRSGVGHGKPCHRGGEPLRGLRARTAAIVGRPRRASPARCFSAATISSSVGAGRAGSGQDRIERLRRGGDQGELRLLIGRGRKCRWSSRRRSAATP